MASFKSLLSPADAAAGADSTLDMKEMLNSEKAFAEALAVAKNSKVAWMDQTERLLAKREPAFVFKSSPNAPSA